MTSEVVFCPQQTILQQSNVGKGSTQRNSPPQVIPRQHHCLRRSGKHVALFSVKCLWNFGHHSTESPNTERSLPWFITEPTVATAVSSQPSGSAWCVIAEWSFAGHLQAAPSSQPAANRLLHPATLYELFLGRWKEQVVLWIILHNHRSERCHLLLPE